MHSIDPPPHQIVTPANKYQQRSLQEALENGNYYQTHLKKKDRLAKAEKTKLRRQCKHYIAPPYAKKIPFDHILISEFHTWLNKAKRIDNRYLEIAIKLDGLLKCMLAKTDIVEFNRLTKLIYDEIAQTSPNGKKNIISESRP